MSPQWHFSRKCSIMYAREAGTTRNTLGRHLNCTILDIAALLSATSFIPIKLPFCEKFNHLSFIITFLGLIYRVTGNQECLEASDCVPKYLAPNLEKLDAVAGKKEELIVSTSHTYEWKNQVRRGKALVYFDLKHHKVACEYCEVFQKLGYKTHLARISSLKAISSKVLR
jgi:hypothetical protein